MQHAVISISMLRGEGRLEKFCIRHKQMTLKSQENLVFKFTCLVYDTKVYEHEIGRFKVIF